MTLTRGAHHAPDSGRGIPTPRDRACDERSTMRMLLGWVINALCLLALPYVLQAVQITDFVTALLEE